MLERRDERRGDASERCYSADVQPMVLQMMRMMPSDDRYADVT